MIKSVCMGKVTQETGGCVSFPVDFDAEVCNPIIGSVVPCTIRAISNTTLFGINLGKVRVLEVFIPMEPRSFQHEVDVSTFSANDTVHVRIVGKRYHLWQETITCVGQIVPETTPESSDAELTPTSTLPISSQIESVDIPDDSESLSDAEEADEEDENASGS